MYKIEYDIKLNDEGRPYIYLPDDYEQNPEDRFFAIEIARYMLQDLLNRKTDGLNHQTVSIMDNAEGFLGQLGDEISLILYGQMKNMGDAEIILDNPYHIEVKSFNEMNSLKEFGNLFEGKIFDRFEGLRVWIGSSGYLMSLEKQVFVDIYELVGGISNEHWVKVSFEDQKEY